MTRRRKLLIGGAVVLALGAGGVGLAQAVGGDSEEQVTGPDADRAKAAAVKLVGGGKAVGVERDDGGGAAWEVEVEKAGGGEVEVRLTSDLKQVGIERRRPGRRRAGRGLGQRLIVRLPRRRSVRHETDRDPASLRAALLLVGACGDDDSGNGSGSTTTGTTTGAADVRSTLPQGSEPVKLDPADFTTEIDNPYWPISARQAVGLHAPTDERIVVTRTNRKKTVAGIEAVVLTRHRHPDDGGGDYVEVTEDWYAQDADGNVWYLGEDTKEYENGKVASTDGVLGARRGRRLCRHHHAGRPRARARRTGRSTTRARRRTSPRS